MTVSKVASSVRVVVLLIDRCDIGPAGLLHAIVGPLQACDQGQLAAFECRTTQAGLPSLRRTLSLTFPTILLSFPLCLEPEGEMGLLAWESGTTNENHPPQALSMALSLLQLPTRAADSLLSVPRG